MCAPETAERTPGVLEPHAMARNARAQSLRDASPVALTLAAVSLLADVIVVALSAASDVRRCSDGYWTLPKMFLTGAVVIVLPAIAVVGHDLLIRRDYPAERLAMWQLAAVILLAAAAVGGGFLASAVQPAAGGDATGLKLLFFLSFVGRLGSLWLLHRVREPDEVAGAFAWHWPRRQLSAVSQPAYATLLAKSADDLEPTPFDSAA